MEIVGLVGLLVGLAGGVEVEVPVVTPGRPSVARSGKGGVPSVATLKLLYDREVA
jgi:hypothetical protein